LATVFKAFNVATSTYDVHLLAGSPAVGTGNATAPLDMNGYARPTPVDLGAYELVAPTIIASSTPTPPPTTTTKPAPKPKPRRTAWR